MPGRAEPPVAVTGAARTVLAFDFGERRIGVAVGQEVSATAEPLATVPVRNGQIDWDAISALVQTWQPALFVLGRPTTADGAPHRLVAAIERFARRLEGRYHRPVSLIDERLSSYAAEHDPAVGRYGVDAVAARVILETWFAAPAARTAGTHETRHDAQDS
ncbi:MAG: Holliday junction resolvase RuvX [Gammaproteobacteria bacterium]